MRICRKRFPMRHVRGLPGNAGPKRTCCGWSARPGGRAWSLDFTGKKPGRGAYVCRGRRTAWRRPGSPGRWTGRWRPASPPRFTRRWSSQMEEVTAWPMNTFLSCWAWPKRPVRLEIGEEPVGSAARAKDARVILAGPGRRRRIPCAGPCHFGQTGDVPVPDRAL